MNSRNYAEDLVGKLNLGHYDTQRKLLDESYQTNWKDIQNQFQNLTSELKKRQEDANRMFNNGLVNVAENSYDRLRSNNASMVNKGLATSGLNNLVQQADTTKKGEEILNLLGSMGDVAVSTGEGLAQGTSNLAKEYAETNKGYGDALGEVGAGQTQAQMDYNTGLAGIAGSKDARDMENALQAAQRAAQNKANSAGTDEIDEKLEEFYRRQAINNILMNTDGEGNSLNFDAQQRANALRILLDVDNAEDVVKMFDENINFTQNKRDNLNKINDLQKQYAEKQTMLDAVSNYDSGATVNQMASSDNPIWSFLGKNLFGGQDKDKVEENKTKLNNEMNDINNKINDLRKNQITNYQELAELLYGNR